MHHELADLAHHTCAGIVDPARPTATPGAAVRRPRRQAIIACLAAALGPSLSLAQATPMTPTPPHAALSPSATPAGPIRIRITGGAWF